MNFSRKQSFYLNRNSKYCFMYLDEGGLTEEFFILLAKDVNSNYCFGSTNYKFFKNDIIAVQVMCELISLGKETKRLPHF